MGKNILKEEDIELGIPFPPTIKLPDDLAEKHAMFIMKRYKMKDIKLKKKASPKDDSARIKERKKMLQKEKVKDHEKEKEHMKNILLLKRWDARIKSILLLIEDFTEELIGHKNSPNTKASTKVIANVALYEMKNHAETIQKAVLDAISNS